MNSINKNTNISIGFASAIISGLICIIAYLGSEEINDVKTSIKELGAKVERNHDGILRASINAKYNTERIAALENKQ